MVNNNSIETGDTLRTSSKEDRKFNRKIRVHQIARQLVMNDSMMTMIEAVRKAESILKSEGRW